MISRQFAAGKIALVNRGGCSFDEKCLNAQKAGAKGCVVVNKDETQIAMNGGGDGAKVTIPSMMVRASALKEMRELGFVTDSATLSGDTQATASPQPHLSRIVYSRID